jgi:hypothetical protein
MWGKADDSLQGVPLWVLLVAVAPPASTVGALILPVLIKVSKGF